MNSSVCHYSVVFTACMLLGFAGCHGNQTSTQAAAPQSQSAPTSQAPPSRILSKASDYAALFSTNSRDEYLDRYSETFHKARTEIDRKLAAISDEELRRRAAVDEWSKVDTAKCEAEADKAHEAEMAAVLQNHRSDLFEIGHVKYDPSGKELQIKATGASPLKDSWYSCSVPMDLAQMDAIYSKLRSIAVADIEAHKRDRMNLYAAHGDASALSNSTVMAEINRDSEEAIRDMRLVLVGQGDIVAHRIDKVMLVDYVTETVFAEFTPRTISCLQQGVTWRH